DHKAHRVGPDIDHRDRLEPVEPHRSDVSVLGKGHCLLLSSLSSSLKRGGEWLFNDCPRPDRLGLNMKYSCALKGFSPSSGTIRRLDPSGRTSQLCWLSFRFAVMI